MRSALRNVLTITGFTAAAVLPSVLHAQQGGIEVPVSMGVGADGSIDMSGLAAEASQLAGAQDEAQPTNTTDPVQKLLAREAGDGKHPIVVIDSVRASEDDLIGFSQSLRSGKVRIKQGGVRTIAGDSKEAEKYGAKAGDKVILITTERGTAAPADSSKAKP